MNEKTPPANVTEAQLRLIYDNIHDLVFLVEVLDEDGNEFRIQSVNKSYLDTTGLQTEDIVGKPFTDVLKKQEVEYVRERYQQAIKSGEPYHYLTRSKIRGTKIYLDTTLVPVFDDDGDCRYLIGVSRNVTQSHIEKRAILEEKARAETYLNIAEALIVALDAEGNVTMMNPKGYRILGYEPGSLTGQCWFDAVIPDERRETFRRTFGEAIEAEQIGSNVNYLVRADGERILVSWANTFIRDDTGKIIGMLSSGEDITERRRAEKAMISSQRMLAAEEVVSAVAHDFNNALQGIVGNLELASMVEGVGSDARERLETALQLAADAASRIKTLQRISNPALENKRVSVDLTTLAGEVIAQTRHLWKDEAERQGKSIAVEMIRDAETDVTTAGNPNELRSVLYNIVKNAIEAIETDGSISIRVSLEENTCRVRVQDTGIGMDTDLSTKVFQPFFSTKGMEAGRGLGMSASFGIIRAHGGELSIPESKPGLGTTVDILLPRWHETDIAPVIEEDPETGEQLRILWVDDDSEVRKLAAGYLKHLGHEGEIAEGGEEALSLLENGEFDLVITDIGMPGMTGFELAAEIATRTQGALPIVALTGWGDQVDVDEGDDIKMVMKKPVRLKDLEAVLDEFAGNR